MRSELLGPEASLMSERVLCQVHKQGLLNNSSMLPLPELPEGGKGLGVVTVSGVCLLNSKFFEDLRTINRVAEHG